MNNRRLKLAIVATHPIHYHVFRWRALAAQPDLEVTVFYCKKTEDKENFSEAFGCRVVWDIPLLGGYRHKFFRNFSTSKGHGFWSVINPGLWLELLKQDFDAIFFLGTHHFTHEVASAIARARKTKVLFYSVCYDLDKRARLKNALRGLAYRYVYRLANTILYIGAHTRAHYKNAGVPDSKLVFAPHFVDYEYFRRSVDGLDKSAAKARFGIPSEAKVILFCAKMFAKKRPDLLLDSFVRAELEGWVLLMVGDGVDRRALMADAARRAPGRVFFTGFLNQSEIGAAYLSAEVHVLPSKEKETWGLVVNESLNFGCAQIVSDMVGCAPDLVAGKTGEVFASGDGAALTAKLRSLNAEPEKWRRYQNAAPAVLASYDLDHYIAGVRTALGLPNLSTSKGNAPRQREAA